MSFEDKKFREVFETLKSYSDNEEKYMSEIIDNAVFILINRRKDDKEDLDQEKINYFSNYVRGMLKDLYDDYVYRTGSKNNIAQEIEYVGSGFTSITFRVGDNVIKFGKSEYGFAPKKLDSVYQVPTYIRESYKVGTKSHFRVEVAPYVDTTNITHEDLYSAYSSIRDLGYIWNDPKEDNLGRIIGVSGCSIGGKRYLPQHQYNQGDLVLIDLDDIAYVGEETSDIILEEIAIASYNKNVYAFETRHMEEKKTNRK